MRSIFFLICLLGCKCFATDSLQKLVEGNKRFVNGELNYPRLSIDQRERLREGQEPFAVILSCSDSRVSPELIFDQGLGDLFVVRVAGNVAAEIELESINYAVKVLHSSVILVMGHQNCGAVNAVLHGQGSAIPEIASWIEPAIEFPDESTLSLEQAVKLNVKRIVSYLKTTSTISEFVSQNKLTVVGGYYHLDTGEVELITHTGV